MAKKLGIIALAILTLAAAPRARAGTEIVRDYGGAQMNNYAPSPPRVYYPPPPPVVVYPAVGFGFYRPFGFFGSHRVFVRRFHRPIHHWH